MITDSSGVVRYVLSGTWDGKIEGAHVLNGDDASAGKVDYETGPSKLLWQRRHPPCVLLAYLLHCRLLLSALRSTLVSVQTP